MHHERLSLQNSEISLPRHHVFAIAFSPRGEWEKVVATVLEHLCCGYPGYWMANEYGNFRYCGEGVVNAMERV